jgi:hypothetical protein
MTDEKKSVADDAKRMLNTGEEITLKSLGKIIVKELSLEQLVLCASEIMKLLESVDFSKQTGLTAFQSILKDPAALNALRVLVAAACSRLPEEFTDMGISDWLKVFAAIKNVFDWEEMKDLFTQLGLTTIFLARMKEARSAKP